MKTAEVSARIALVGERTEAALAHRAIPKALELAGATPGVDGSVAALVAFEWVPTPELDPDAALRLAGFDGIWCVPATPYASMEGALSAIRLAREGGIPFLGTCGGFQHALIEFARHRLGMAGADHAETNPGAGTVIVSPLSCPLVEREGPIRLLPGTRAARFYGTTETVEGYHCSYGMDPRFRGLFEAAGFQVTGTDDQGEVRVMELLGHPFFVGTLFQPERWALKYGTAHPLVAAFVAAARAARGEGAGEARRG